MRRTPEAPVQKTRLSPHPTPPLHWSWLCVCVCWGSGERSIRVPTEQAAHGSAPGSFTAFEQLMSNGSRWGISWRVCWPGWG